MYVLCTCTNRLQLICTLAQRQLSIVQLLHYHFSLQHTFDLHELQLMWTGVSAVHEGRDDSGCDSENRLCFLKLPAGIAFDSVLHITLTLHDPRAALDSVHFSCICRAYDSKRMLSRSAACVSPPGGSNTVLQLTHADMQRFLRVKPDKPKISIAIVVDSVIPSYKIPHAAMIIIRLPIPTEPTRLHSPHMYVLPCVARSRLLKTIVSAESGVTIHTDIDRSPVHCALTVLSAEGFAVSTHHMVTRRTQVIIAFQDDPIHSTESKDNVNQESILAFDVHDEQISLPIYANLATRLHSSSRDTSPRVCSTLLCGEEGAGRSAFIRGLVALLNRGHNDRIAVLEISAAAVMAEGKECSDKELKRILAFALISAFAGMHLSKIPNSFNYAMVRACRDLN